MGLILISLCKPSVSVKRFFLHTNVPREMLKSQNNGKLRVLNILLHFGSQTHGKLGMQTAYYIRPEMSIQLVEFNF